MSLLTTPLHHAIKIAVVWKSEWLFPFLKPTVCADRQRDLRRVPNARRETRLAMAQVSRQGKAMSAELVGG